jgi:uncharacterized protein DUF1572
MSEVLAAITHEFRRHKSLADKAIAQLEGELLFARPAAHANSPAIVIKHLSGNLRSRWTDFLNSDGEKPTRNRDGEFVLGPADTRDALLGAWDDGWRCVFDSLAGLTEADFSRTVMIRGEPHTVIAAVLRGLTHAAYHTGQILYHARLLRPDSAWLTIPPGQSDTHRPGYLSQSPPP